MFPEKCATCGASRQMIQEKRAYYSCGKVVETDGSASVPCRARNVREPLPPQLSEPIAPAATVAIPGLRAEFTGGTVRLRITGNDGHTYETPMTRVEKVGE